MLSLIRPIALLLALAALPQAAAQVCRLSVAGLNRGRAVLGGVNVECPGGLHSAPFGNWGVTSNFGPLQNGSQFEGWCHRQSFTDNAGSSGSCSSRWREWNSCTSHFLYQAPNCTLYNAAGCTQQVTATGVNVLGTQTVDLPVSCPEDSDGDGLYDRGGCAAVREYSHGTNFMSLYELDPITPNELVQTLFFPETPVELTCDAWGCLPQGSAWVEPVSYDSPPGPPRAYAEFSMFVNFGAFADPAGACALRPGPLTAVSAASFDGDAIAGGSLVSLFGANLAPVTAAARENPPPNELGGVRVVVVDGTGIPRFAQLLFVSPQQINFVAPFGMRFGEAAIAVQGPDGTRRAEGTVAVEQVAPGIFTSASNGQGVAAGLLVSNLPDGGQRFQLTFTCEADGGGCQPVPVRLDPAMPSALVLFGTGLRGHRGLDTIQATIGGEAAEVFYAGLQGTFAGLDQVNIGVPTGLAARGEVEIRLRADGRDANPVSVVIE